MIFAERKGQQVSRTKRPKTLLFPPNTNTSQKAEEQLRSLPSLGCKNPPQPNNPPFETQLRAEAGDEEVSQQAENTKNVFSFCYLRNSFMGGKKNNSKRYLSCIPLCGTSPG